MSNNKYFTRILSMLKKLVNSPTYPHIKINDKFIWNINKCYKVGAYQTCEWPTLVRNVVFTFCVFTIGAKKYVYESYSIM